MARRTRCIKRANSARGASWRGVTEAQPLARPGRYPASGKPFVHDAALAATRLGRYGFKTLPVGGTVRLYAPGTRRGHDEPVFEAPAGSNAFVAAVAVVESLLSPAEARGLTWQRKEWRSAIESEAQAMRAMDAAVRRVPGTVESV